VFGIGLISGGLKMGKDNLPICPFCGNKAQLETERYWAGGNIYYIRCMTSQCIGHPIKPTVFFDKDKAIKAWSMRKGE
jgi:hypothetical protein